MTQDRGKRVSSLTAPKRWAGIILAVAGMITVIYVSTRMIMMGQFIKLEQTFVSTAVQQGREALLREIHYLDAKSFDWANWDDTYQFVVDRNAAYIKSNLTTQALIGIDINFMIFLDASGQPIFSYGVDLQSGEPRPAADSLIAFLRKEPALTRFSPGQSLPGVLMLPEGPLLFVSRPILRSEGAGPVRGTLVFARFMDDELVRRLGEITHLMLSISPASGRNVPKDIQSAAAVVKDNTVLSRPEGKDRILGYGAVTDVFGRPGVILKVEAPRRIYQQGEQAMRYFLGVLVFLGGLVVYGFFVPLARETVRREVSELRLAKLNECFLGFGTDPVQNIKRIMALCGELLGASCVFYTRVPGGTFHVSCCEHPAEGFGAVEKLVGHLCQDIIAQGGTRVEVIPELRKSVYTDTDPESITFGCRSYVGIPVKWGQDGVGVLALLYGQPFSPDSKDKKLISILASAIQIEETRMQAQHILADSEARFRLILDSAAEAIYGVDLSGYCIFCNPSCARILGYASPEDLLGQSLHEKIHHSRLDGTSLPAETCQIHGVIRTGESVHGEEVLWRADGTPLFAEIWAYPQEQDGRVTGSVVTFLDITERKLAESALRESDARYKKIIASVSDYIYTVHLKDGKPVDTIHGAGCQAVTGHSPEEFRTRPFLWSEIIFEADREMVVQRVEAIASEQNVLPFEHRIVHKDGSVRWLRNTPVLYFDEHGRLTAYDGVVQDITAIKEYEQRLLKETERAMKNEHEAVKALDDLKRAQAANISILANLARSKKNLEKQSVDLEEALAVKNEFTSTVSHELRTPLAISKEALSLLLRGKVGGLSQKQEEIIMMAAANLDRLALLVNDILDIAKIEAGKMELNKEPLDIVEIIRASCEEWTLKAATKQVTIRVSVPSGQLMVPLDKGRFLQILGNLFSNAIKFSPEQGQIEVSVQDAGPSVQIAVKDSGPGISKNDFPKLFQKFQQLHRTSGPGLRGTGLGLSIAKSLVEMHGGEIHAESEVGQGAVFMFTLPKPVPS